MSTYAVFYGIEFVVSFDNRKDAYECAKYFTLKYNREYSVRENYKCK